MHNFSFIDETFDIDLSLNYTLSIQVCLNGFSFSVFDLKRKKFIYLQHINLIDVNDNEELLTELEKLLSDNNYLKLNYKQTKIIIYTKKSTIVPAELFTSKSANKFFNFSNIKDSEANIFYNNIKNSDSFIISEIDKELQGLFEDIFADLKFYHQAIPFIDENLLVYKNKLSKPKVFVNKFNNYIDIIVLKNNKLLLHNTFEYKTLEDFVFNVMYVYEQLKLNSIDIELIVSGEIDKKSEEFKLLKKYIKIVSFANINKAYTYSYTFKQIPLHSYTNLFNLQSCE